MCIDMDAHGPRGPLEVWEPGDRQVPPAVMQERDDGASPSAARTRGGEGGTEDGSRTNNENQRVCRNMASPAALALRVWDQASGSPANSTVRSSASKPLCQAESPSPGGQF